MTLHIQKFLQAGGTPEQLTESRGIVVRPHSRHSNLLHFKYDMIESPMGDPIVRECRGLVLDRDRNWMVRARAFDKFFNYGEGHAAAIDWPTARVQEKLDGTLCILYYYEGQWEVATTGSADAGGPVISPGPAEDRDLSAPSFAEYFHEVHRTITGKDFDGDDLLCYMLELMGPKNKIIVQHPEPRLVLLGARHRVTQEEIRAEQAAPSLWGEIEIVREFPLRSLDEVQATFWTMSPLKQEGYVVVDAAFRRIKVKHPGYVALHHMLSGLTPRNMLEIVRTGEVEEVVAAFPEYETKLLGMTAQYRELVAAAEAEYQRVAAIENQKDFALAIRHLPYSGILFSHRAGKIPSIADGFRNARVDSIAQMLLG